MIVPPPASPTLRQRFKSFFERKTYRFDALEELEANKKQGQYTEQELLENEDRIECDEDEANLVSSLMSDPVYARHDQQAWHMPVLDIDIPCRLIPSSTPGHHHLYIDAPMRWVDYKRLLILLRDLGIIEAGFCDLSIKRGASFVRHPECKKGVGRKPKVKQTMTINVPIPSEDDDEWPDR